jgi:hypothetical protein
LITVTFNNDDPNVVRSDMAAMLGFTSVGPAALADAEPGPVGSKSAVEGDKADTAEKPPRKPRGSNKATVTDVVAQNAATEPQQAIQTGGERNPPEEPVKPEVPVLTQDDVRAAAGRYVEKFGMAAAQADVGKLLMDIAGVSKMSDLVDKPQDQLAAIIAKVGQCVDSGTQYVTPALV